MLSGVFRFKLPGILSDPVLRDLIRSFKMEAPPRPVWPPSWDLTMVLRFLNSSTFEPLHSCSLWNLTKKVLFLVSLATAKRIWELQAVSRSVYFVGPDSCLSYVLEFVAKTNSFSNPPSSLILGEVSCRLSGWFGGRLVVMSCQGPAGLPLSDWVRLSSSSAFCVASAPTRSISKNGVSFFLREVIYESGARRVEGGSC